MLLLLLLLLGMVVVVLLLVLLLLLLLLLLSASPPPPPLIFLSLSTGYGALGSVALFVKSKKAPTVASFPQLRCVKSKYLVPLAPAKLKQVKNIHIRIPAVDSEANAANPCC